MYPPFIKVICILFFTASNDYVDYLPCWWRLASLDIQVLRIPPLINYIYFACRCTIYIPWVDRKFPTQPAGVSATRQDEHLIIFIRVVFCYVFAGGIDRFYIFKIFF